MPSLAAHLLVGLTAAAISFAAVPLTGRLAVRYGAVAVPEDRADARIRPVPAAGGAAMLAGVVGAVGAALLIDDFAGVAAARTELAGVLAAAAIAFAVGFYDDRRDISPPAKVAGMALAGAVLFFAGGSILVFRAPFLDLLILSSDWSALVTVLWVVGMANAVNLVDGLDGLAAGIVAIASATFLAYAMRLADAGVIGPDNPGALWAVITLGVCLGFLPHNLFPARVFMGDGGSLLLGVLLAASTMSVGGRSTGEFSGQSFFFFAPIFISLVILGVPLLDTAFAIVRRLVRRQGLSVPDRGHLHHRLVRLGHGHRRSVLVLWAWTALLSAFVLYPTYTGRGDGVVPFGIAALVLMLYTALRPRLGGGEVEVDEAELDRLNRR